MGDERTDKLAELQRRFAPIKVARFYETGDHFGLSPVLVFSKRGKTLISVREDHITLAKEPK